MSCGTVRNRVGYMYEGMWVASTLVGVPKSHVLPGACQDAGAVYYSLY